VFIGPRMAAHARARYGEPRRYAVIETGAVTSELSADGRRESPAESDLERWCDSRVVFSYVGNMGHVHDIDTLKAAVPRLAGGERCEDIGILIAGSGPGIEALKTAWRELPADRVRFEPPLADRAWARLLARSDVSLVTLRDEAGATSLPSKTLSAMASSNAILAVAPTPSDLSDVVTRHDCGEVVTPGDVDGLVAALRRLAGDPVELARQACNAKNAIRDRYDLARLATHWEQLLEQARNESTHEADAIKRALDIAVSAAGLVATAPVLAALTVMIRATMGSPALFRQKRPGKDGAPFELVKFRTMRDPKPHETGPEHDNARTTRLGQFMRSTSLDELPTLLNVLAGDMTLVGPRPLLWKYLARYSPEQKRRLEAVPGITGWAQVNGRNRISWDEKFALDVWYVDNRSLMLDLRILAMTAAKVLKREDIDQDENITMPEFMGSDGPAPRPRQGA